MIDQNEHRLVAQWISAKKDSVFITEKLLYYGKFKGEIPNKETLDKMASIPLSYLKSLQINRDKKTTILEYGHIGGPTVDIRWENSESINSFKNRMMQLFPHARIIPGEERTKTEVKAPIAALIVIPIIYLIALAADASHSNQYHPGGNSRRMGSEAIIALFRALKSMGIPALTALFGGLFLIALFALFRARKKSSHITLIELR